jgi:hypothetical protein
MEGIKYSVSYCLTAAAVLSTYESETSDDQDNLLHICKARILLEIKLRDSNWISKYKREIWLLISIEAAKINSRMKTEIRINQPDRGSWSCRNTLNDVTPKADDG